MSKVAAVVVTHDRLSMLKRCVGALEHQTFPCDVFVVNNASRDGTGEWLNARTGIFHRNTGENLGGAGGFSIGVRWAVESGCDHVWLMDDDCIPEPDALEKLMDAREYLGEFGYLSSAVLWTDGRQCRMNRPKYSAKQPPLPDGIRRITQATFVSLLVPADVVRRYGLPIRDFFIWGDDIEYTRRISLPGYQVAQSRVLHAMETNSGSSIARDVEERIGRYYYAFRNECFLYRQEGFKGWVWILAKNCWHSLRVLLQSPSRRGKRLKQIWQGFSDGLKFSPQVEYLE